MNLEFNPKTFNHSLFVYSKSDSQYFVQSKPIKLTLDEAKYFNKAFAFNKSNKRYFKLEE